MHCKYAYCISFKNFISLIYYIQKVYFEKIDGVGVALLLLRGGDEEGLIFCYF